MSSQASNKTMSSTSAMPGIDAFWEYAEKELDHPRPNRVKCKLCGHSMSGGITRIKEHLGGIKGNVSSCKQVPDDVKAKAISALKATREVKETNIAKKASERDEVVIGVQDDEDDVEIVSNMKKKGPMDKHVLLSPEEYANRRNKGRGLQMTMDDAKWKKKAREDACEYIARWMYEAGIPFNTVTLPSFDHMLHAVGQCGPGLKGPSPYELGGKFLQREVDRTKEKLSIFTESCKINGCSLSTDAWTDKKGRSIMNLMVHCEVGTSFLRSKNTSADVHDGKFIYELVDNAISEIGEENVVQVVTDNASNNMAAAKLLAVKRPSIFWTSCAAHTINLMLGDIGKIKPINNVIKMGRSITVFIYGHTFSLDLMRKFTEKLDSHDIIRPGVTRFATAFLSLESIREKKKELRQMFSSSQWDNSKLSKTEAAKRVYKIIFSSKFWENVDLALKVFEPLVKVLRRVDGDVPSMGWLYEDLEKAKNDIATALKMEENKYRAIWKIIDTRWDAKLKTSLHRAGYFLNPHFFYSKREEIERDGSFMDGVIDCMSKMYANNPDMQDKISEQLSIYQFQ